MLFVFLFRISLISRLIGLLILWITNHTLLRVLTFALWYFIANGLCYLTWEEWGNGGRRGWALRIIKWWESLTIGIYHRDSKLDIHVTEIRLTLIDVFVHTLSSWSNILSLALVRGKFRNLAHTIQMANLPNRVCRVECLSHVTRSIAKYWAFLRGVAALSIWFVNSFNLWVRVAHYWAF